MSLYRNILKQALKITWRHKYLWFFGLFASLIGNSAGDQILVYNLNGNVSENFLATVDRFQSTGIFNINIFASIAQLFKNDPIAIIISLIMMLIVLILFILIIWLSIMSQICLVKNSAQIINRNSQSKVFGIKDSAISGIKYFWSVFGVNLLLKIIIFSILFLPSLPLLFGIIRGERISQNFKINLLYIILFTLCASMAIIISFIGKYAIAYIALKNTTLVKAIKQAWRLFINNWLISLEMAFILFFINFTTGLIIMFAMFMLIGSFLFTSMFAGLGWIILVGIFLLLFIIITFGSALTTFQTAAWTNLFIKLTNNKNENLSKLERMFGRTGKSQDSN